MNKIDKINIAHKMRADGFKNSEIMERLNISYGELKSILGEI